MQTLTFRTLYVFVVISHDRRRIEHWNVTTHPTAAWVWRQVIAATPWGQQPRFLIRDPDTCYGAEFIARARRIGIETTLTPIRAPPPRPNGRAATPSIFLPANQPRGRRSGALPPRFLSQNSPTGHWRSLKEETN